VSYPVTFSVTYEEQRSRLSTFFRLILAIPILIWVGVYALIASIAVVIAWFVMVVSASYPRSLYDFVAGYLRIQTLAVAYSLLLCDPYPPFTGEAPGYPVEMTFSGPLPQYSRAKALFRIILAIPILILRYVINLLLEVGAVAAWCVIVILGRLPRGLFDMMVLANSYIARSDAYLLLLTETYPPFQDETTRAAGI
jgi:Domain of unknown function (DUF4389)